MNNPTNLQRLLYILDVLAEPFPPKAKEASCGCGDPVKPPPTAAPSTVPDVVDKPTPLSSVPAPSTGNRKSVRELIEEALAATMSTTFGGNLQDAASKLSEEQLGQLLKYINTAEVDLQLRDLALFMDPQRATTFAEIVDWDRKRANRPLIK